MKEKPENASKQNSLTRRTFLKGAGTAGAVSALGIGMNIPAMKVFAEKSSSNVPKKTEKLFGYCTMCSRHDCATLTTVENGVVTSVDGRHDCPTNQGTMCARGKSVIMDLYNPYRVKAPMKRTNPKKGFDEDPGWVEITWDEALETVGKKLKEIHDNDPRELVTFEGFGAYDTIFGSPHIWLPHIFGTPNDYISPGPLCEVHYANGLINGVHPIVVADHIYGKYLLCIGRSHGPNLTSANGETRAFFDNIDRGVKTVVVDPRCSVEASKTNWVPIKPGTDLPFALSLLHTILYEVKKYDVDFLKNRSNAPYLIDPDGNYLRGASKKPQIWDLADNKAKDFNDPSLTDPALEGEYTVAGVKVKPGFVMVKEGMKDYTPEWAEKKTTIPAAKIREIATEFVEYAMIGSTIDINGVTFPYRPAAAFAGRGALNHQDGTALDLSVKLLNELVGCMDVPGGHLAAEPGPLLKPCADGIVQPLGDTAADATPFNYPFDHFSLKEVFPHGLVTFITAVEGMIDPEKFGLEIKPKGLFVHGSNPMISVCSSDLCAEAFKNVPFVASIVTHFDEVAQLSDIILPEHTSLERPSIVNFHGSASNQSEYNCGLEGVRYRQPVKPLYNTRFAHDIYIDLFEKIGLLAEHNRRFNAGVGMGYEKVPLTGKNKLDLNKKYTIAEIWDRMLKSRYGDKFGMAYLDKHGMNIHRLPREKCYNYYYPGSETRYQFYLETVKRSGDLVLDNLEKHKVEIEGLDKEDMRKAYSAVPQWRETKLFQAPKEYNLYAYNYKNTFIQRAGGMDHQPALTDWNEKNNPYFDTIGLNTKTAAKMGLKKGDTVVVESQYGKVKAKVNPSELFHPDSVAVGGATGRRVKTLGKKASERMLFNDLMGSPIGTFDPINGAIDIVVAVKVYKA